MKLGDVPHPVLGYCTFGMGGSSDRRLARLVERLVIVDHGEQVALFYAPGRRPWRHIVKAAAKTFAGTMAINLATTQAKSEIERATIRTDMTKAVGALVGDDLTRAVENWRTEGYYRLDGHRYYKGPIEVGLLALNWPRLSPPESP